jgi:serine O-acetyltransferase
MGISKLIKGRIELHKTKKEWVRRAVEAVEKNDPASQDEKTNKRYPGVIALYHHRFAHMLWTAGYPRWARRYSERWRRKTGIEIHPGAEIGTGVFIDHGMGVVIGETSVVGEDCVMYQGVTLGGTGKRKEKRHPTLGKNVMVGAGAKLLGNITIGNHVKIGAGSVVVSDVPSDSTVVGVPGRVVRGVKENGTREKLPDPLVDMLLDMKKRIENLEKKIENKG